MEEGIYIRGWFMNWTSQPYLVSILYYFEIALYKQYDYLIFFYSAPHVRIKEKNKIVHICILFLVFLFLSFFWQNQDTNSLPIG